MRKLSIVGLAIGLAACATNPDGTINWTQSTTNYANALNATTNVVKAIGQDIVAIDCKYGALVEVIAKDAGAAQRVQNALAKNTKVINDACPMLVGSPPVQVVAGS